MVKEAYPDETALDPKSAKHDPKATSDKPRWFMVDVKFVSHSSLQATDMHHASLVSGHRPRLANRHEKSSSIQALHGLDNSIAVVLACFPEM